MPSFLTGAGGGAGGAALTAAAAFVLATLAVVLAVPLVAFTALGALAATVGASLFALGAGARSIVGFSGSELGFAVSGGAAGSALGSAFTGCSVTPEVAVADAAPGGDFPESSI